MVMYSIILTSPEVYPPINTPLVELEAPPAVSLAADKSPKSVAFPVVAIVTKSIVSVVDPASPPANTPLVGDATPA